MDIQVPVKSVLMAVYEGQADAEQNTRLRIAFATVQFDHVGSGPGTFTCYVRNAHSIPVDLVFFSEDIPGSARTEAAIPVASRLNIPFVQVLLRSQAYRKEILVAERTKPFDLVWYNTAPPLALFSALRRHASPVVVMVSDYSNAVSRWPWSTRKAFGWKRSISRSVLRMLERIALKRAYAVVANSAYTRDAVIREYGLDPSRVSVLHKAVDKTAFESHGEPARMKWPVRVLFLKSDFMLGGLADVLSALSSLPHPCVLTVAGPKMSDYGRVMELAQTSGFDGELTFVGRIPRDKVPDLIRAHDLLCVPSRAEALGVVFLEALASGVPVVASNVGGIVEVLDHGNAGWMVEPFDPVGLTDTLKTVIEDESARLEKIKAGKTHVERFKLESMLSRFGDLAVKIHDDARRCN